MRSDTLHAIGFFDVTALDRRVMTLIHHRPVNAASRRPAIVAAVLLGVATSASPISPRLERSAHAIFAPQTQQSSGPVKLSPEDAAAKLISRPAPVYPPEARDKGIQGAVVLHAIIAKDGTIKQLAVISGPKELQASAIDAVKQWRYVPYLVDGDVVEVETDITVNYTLSN